MDDLVNSEINRITGERKSQRNKEKPKGLVEHNALTEFFVDDFKNATNGLVNEVIMPEIKGLGASILHALIDRWFYKRKGPVSHTGSLTYSSGQTNYNGVSSSLVRNVITTKTDYSQPKTTSRKQFDFSDLIFRDYTNAKDFLESMRSVVESSPPLSVAELYDALYKDVDYDYTVNDWGWYDLSSARILCVPTGFKLELPPPVQITTK